MSTYRIASRTRNWSILPLNGCQLRRWAADTGPDTNQQMQDDLLGTSAPSLHSFKSKSKLLKIEMSRWLDLNWRANLIGPDWRVCMETANYQLEKSTKSTATLPKTASSTTIHTEVRSHCEPITSSHGLSASGDGKHFTSIFLNFTIANKSHKRLVGWLKVFEWRSANTE